MEVKLSQKLSEKTREIQCLEQKITQTKHKLRMRTQIVEGLQIQTKRKELVAEFEQLEAISLEAEQLKDKLAEQAGHNHILGQEIESLKREVESKIGAGRSDLSVAELNQVFAELSAEVDNYRRKVDAQKQSDAKNRKVADLLVECRQIEKQIGTIELEANTVSIEAEQWRAHYHKQALSLSVLKETQVALADEAVSHLECLKVLEDKQDKKRQQSLVELNAALKELHESQRRRVADAKLMCRANPSQERELAKRLVEHETEDESRKVALLTKALSSIQSWTSDTVRQEHLAKHHALTAMMRTDEESTRQEALERQRVVDLARW
eukprot:CAMPEP_0204916306 /NCGR_PEP_ID=MMETSP1397-20131031/14156_1 /ASSEMBLY_ACC=CAM_ASM_000891 /TAXON_ID=49980 /ORGANISM="Climacostomum Climacostomum virens, Strain Stock W-24" /LENGTH=323 /DNA_ID=CAMNT_0052088759 /DNA_START=101 /DNA_END=1069 /DNA_ORIENTATION=+